VFISTSLYRKGDIWLSVGPVVKYNGGMKYYPHELPEYSIESALGMNMIGIDMPPGTPEYFNDIDDFRLRVVERMKEIVDGRNYAEKSKLFYPPLFFDEDYLKFSGHILFLWGEGEQGTRQRSYLLNGEAFALAMTIVAWNDDELTGISTILFEDYKKARRQGMNDALEWIIERMNDPTTIIDYGIVY
jgi:hypothetical protein